MAQTGSTKTMVHVHRFDARSIIATRTLCITIETS